MRVMLAQVNPTIGDLRGNLALMQSEIDIAVRNKCNVVVFPELVTVGYPPRDLLYDNELWLNHDLLVAKLHGWLKLFQNEITVIFGGLHQVQLSHGRYARYNAAFVMDKDGVRVVHKRLLPCYDVFDETRYFVPAIDEPYLPIFIRDEGELVACDVLICEDIWNFQYTGNVSWMAPATYTIDPVSNLRGRGPVFVINGSPFWMGKIRRMVKQMIPDMARTLMRPILWVNQIGAHDDIVFGGYSMAMSPFADSPITAKAFQTDRLFVTTEPNLEGQWHCSSVAANSGLPQAIVTGAKDDHKYAGGGDDASDKEQYEIWTLFEALRLSLVDYCRRTGFQKIVFGASGGIDSAVVGAIAAVALGGENCLAVTMPAKYSSEGSWKDAEELARRCKMPFLNINIGSIHETARSKLLSGGKQQFERRVTDENLQPRIRGMILMALSNEEGSLLLTTGNKSELAVGYCTIYGDMCGGYALLTDVPKTMVWKLARFINKHFGNIIPENSIEKPPSAELAPGQKDTDSLPPYDLLDPVIEDILHHVPINVIKTRTTIPERVDSVIRMINTSEFKRAQAAMGPKVTERAFGSGRRIPVAKNVTYIS